MEFLATISAIGALLSEAAKLSRFRLGQQKAKVTELNRAYEQRKTQIVELAARLGTFLATV